TSVTATKATGHVVAQLRTHVERKPACRPWLTSRTNADTSDTMMADNKAPNSKGAKRAGIRVERLVEERRIRYGTAGEGAVRTDGAPHRTPGGSSGSAGAPSPDGASWTRRRRPPWRVASPGRAWRQWRHPRAVPARAWGRATTHRSTAGATGRR